MVKHIYYSPSIDRSDYTDERTYYHDASGTMELMHLGAYFDPGMEFDLPEDLMTLSKDALEEIFNSAFTGEGTRIIKSHVFANNIEFLKACWPNCPIVLVHRSDDACLGWWVKCGHFDITYPSYDEYYKDFRTMAAKIKQQNQGISNARLKYNTSVVHTSLDLCGLLGITFPRDGVQNYSAADINVCVI